MIEVLLHISEYDWTVRVHCAVHCYHADTIAAELNRLDCPEQYLRRAYTLMKECRLDTGLTYSNKNRRESVVVVGLTSSAAEFQNSLQHELYHLVEDIGSYDNRESPAYLIGEINRALFPYVRRLLCDECRAKLTAS